MIIITVADKLKPQESEKFIRIVTTFIPEEKGKRYGT